MAGGRSACSGLDQSLAGRRMPGLDGLRAIAVFLVIAYHFGIPGAPGGHGVLLFFVLSGFLITRLLVLEEENTGAVSLGAFYARRTLRIFPAFYAYSALVIAAMLAAGRPVLWPQAIASLLYVNNYYQALHGDPNTAFSHTWSLAVEEQFYLLWPGIFILLRSRKARLTGASAIILAVWIQRAVRAIVFHTPDGYIYEALDTRLDSLLVGCVAALLVSQSESRRRVENWICARWKMVATLILLVLSLFIQSAAPRWYREAIGFATDPLLIMVLILQVLAFSSLPAVSWLEWPWVRFLGRISYPLYLYQQIVISSLEKRLASFPAIVAFPVVVGGCILAASASYFVIEKPALRWKARFERVRTA